MDTVNVCLPFKNEGSKSMKLYLEPYSEFFYIQAGQKVVINAVCAKNTDNFEFVVAHNDSYFTVYAPGAPTELMDAYVTLNGVKLAPDSN